MKSLFKNHKKLRKWIGGILIGALIFLGVTPYAEALAPKNALPSTRERVAQKIAKFLSSVEDFFLAMKMVGDFEERILKFLGDLTTGSAKKKENAVKRRSIKHK